MREIRSERNLPVVASLKNHHHENQAKILGLFYVSMEPHFAVIFLKTFLFIILPP
jgi:hypothetical protein